MYDSEILIFLIMFIVPGIVVGALVLYSLGRHFNIASLSPIKSAEIAFVMGGVALAAGYGAVYLEEYQYIIGYPDVVEQWIPILLAVILVAAALLLVRTVTHLSIRKAALIALPVLLVSLVASYTFIFAVAPHIRTLFIDGRDAGPHDPANKAYQGPGVGMDDPQAEMGVGEAGGYTYAYQELFKSSNYVFECKVPVPAPDSDACRLYAKDAKGDQHDLDLFADVISGAIFVAPDQKHVLVVSEESAILIDVDTLAKKEVLRAAKGTWLGYDSNLPAFYAKAKWIDAKTIQVPVYQEGTQTDEVPKPLEIKTISL